MIFERNVGGIIAGVARGKFSRLLEDAGGVLAAKFRPAGFHPFVGVPISTFTDSVSPKWGIQGYRLHEAAEQLASRTSISHSALALDLGYTDQAHFAHDFKALVGTSPAAYARAARRARR